MKLSDVKSLDSLTAEMVVVFSVINYTCAIHSFVLARVFRCVFVVAPWGSCTHTKRSNEVGGICHVLLPPPSVLQLQQVRGEHDPTNPLVHRICWRSIDITPPRTRLIHLYIFLRLNTMYIYSYNKYIIWPPPSALCLWSLITYTAPSLLIRPFFRNLASTESIHASFRSFCYRPCHLSFIIPRRHASVTRKTRR